MNIPTLTTKQMREVDSLMINNYGISLLQMMENAGRNLAELTRRLLGGLVNRKRVVVLCGPGNNGGGGLAAARHLHNWGAKVIIKLSIPSEELKQIPSHQLQSLHALGLDENENIDETADIVIDALLGYGVIGNPQSNVARLIQWANEQPAPVLSLDIPSGLDVTSGEPYNPTVRSTSTLTLALPKSGLMVPSAREFAGDLYLADISVPQELYERIFNIKLPNMFQKSAIIRIR
jgi:NAD(P)H-hydrate epimerase